MDVPNNASFTLEPRLALSKMVTSSSFPSQGWIFELGGRPRATAGPLPQRGSWPPASSQLRRGGEPAFAPRASEALEGRHGRTVDAGREGEGMVWVYYNQGRSAYTADTYSTSYISHISHPPITNILLLLSEDLALHNLMPGRSAPRHIAFAGHPLSFAVWENPHLHDWGSWQRLRLGRGHCYRTGLCKGRAARQITVAISRGDVRGTVPLQYLSIVPRYVRGSGHNGNKLRRERTTALDTSGTQDEQRRSASGR
jgi:hypothetical protein